MKNNFILAIIEQLKERIVALQSAVVGLKEQLKKQQNNFENTLDQSALKIIDILDMINMVTANNLNRETNLALLLEKIEKNLVALLRAWQVQEITVVDYQIDPSKLRVVDTRQSVENIAITKIIEICRKGYQRGNKIIRPADVITSKTGKDHQ